MKGAAGVMVVNLMLLVCYIGFGQYQPLALVLALFLGIALDAWMLGPAWAHEKERRALAKLNREKP